MNLIEAIILGIIQGATEFLPVSSSGHSVLLPALFGMSRATLDLIAIAHLGTLTAVFIYFWNDLWDIVVGVLSGLRKGHPLGNPDARLGWFIAAGSIPAAVAGLTLEDFFEEIFGEPVYAAFFLLITALLLVVGERLLSGHKEIPQITLVDAVIIGFFQMVALFPGISRSGSTITGGLMRGLDREAAARFSFLLGVPAIFGAGLLALVDIVQAGAIAEQWSIYLGTFLAAAVSGYLCIYFLLAWLREHSLYIFAIYCALFGVSYLVLSLLGIV